MHSPSLDAAKSPIKSSEKYRPVHDLVLSLYLEFMRLHHSSELRTASSPDLTSPHQWFPFARSIHRRIIYHAGEIFIASQLH